MIVLSLFAVIVNLILGEIKEDKILFQCRNGA